MTNGTGGPGDHDEPRAPITDVPAFGNTTEYLISRPTREPAPEAVFSFLALPLADGDLRVVEARVREALGQLYEAAIELCSSDATLDFDALLGARCALQIARGPRLRRVCGVVRRVERLNSWAGRRRARVVLVPALWALSQRTDLRIFQNLTSVEIAQEVLKEAGLDTPVTLELRREYPKREYCVQYRETDLAFVLRLLEEEGIVLYFKHDGEVEEPVLADSPTYLLCPTIDRRPVPFSPAQSELAPVEVVHRLDFTRELRSTGASTRDYDFTRPQAEIDMSRAHPRGDAGPRGRYEYPARFTLGGYDEGGHAYAEHDGARQAELRNLEERALEGVGGGVSSVTGFMPGRVFQLEGHEHADLDLAYLITRVEHTLRAPEELLADGAERKESAGGDRYRNEFDCVPADVAWVPPRRSPRPMVLATQTATVTGPAGEEIHTDFHGRVKVQFHWDRQGRRDENSSCWVRVAQAWAGAGWGFQFIPRIGMEVVVQFLEGDPDKPLVTGCVYNGVNNTPYALPAEKTRSTIKSNSSLGGGGYNELRFEDLAGTEEVFLHAQKDLNEVVEHDHAELVKHDKSLHVGHDLAEVVDHDHSETVQANKTLHVKGNQKIVVDGEGELPEGQKDPGVDLHVTGVYNVFVSKDYKMQVGTGTVKIFSSDNQSLTVQATKDVNTTATEGYNLQSKNTTLSSSEGLTTMSKTLLMTSATGTLLMCGGSMISMTPSDITIMAPTVKIVAVGNVEITAGAEAKINGAVVKLNC